MSKPVVTMEEPAAVTRGMREPDAFDELTLDELAATHGGMRWEQFRRSTNIEDRRGWSRERSMHAPITVARGG
jgi:hypothetical protein